MHRRLPRKQIVLLGIGHTNAHIMRMWRMKPQADTGLVCVSNSYIATYSGMMPGVLAGQYPSDRMAIDLARLTASAGARLIVDQVTGLDTDRRELLFQSRPPFPFDVLSIGIGSHPSKTDVAFEEDAPVLSIKPMQSFLARMANRVGQVAGELSGRPLRVVVVGGGIGGVEITFCLPMYLRKVLKDVTTADVNQRTGNQKNCPWEITLIHGGPSVPNGANDRTAELTRRELESRRVDLRLNQRVLRVGTHSVSLHDGTQVDADLVIWATGAVSPPLLSKLGLPVDDRGFLRTDHALRTVAGYPIFAVGDSGTIENENLPKAGVYAVRQGPVLWRNLANLLDGRMLEKYEPQRRFLKLLNTGDGKAIAEYGDWAFRGRWALRLKDFIDKRFMDRYQDYTPMEMGSPPPDLEATQQMRCAGCGGKIGGTVLSKVLRRLDLVSSLNSPHVLVGLDRPDDVAVLRSHGDQIAVTTDFFSAPLDDPFISGQMAALNAVSDIYASGATPTAALAMVTIPHGDRDAQENLLHEMLAGSLHVLRDHEIALVGGHTIEGAQLTLGFTVLGMPDSKQIHAKSDLRVGDALVLTKPIGSGVLLAAHMQARCKASWLEAFLRYAVQSNRDPAAALQGHGLSALTDVTGFGLAGHLLELLKSSGVACQLVLGDIDLYDGVVELAADGIESTLAPANRDAEQEIVVNEAARRTPHYAALFDPQTCGGLLAGVQSDRVTEALQALRIAGVIGTVIGKVTEHDENARRISVI